MKLKSKLIFVAILTGIFFTSCSSKFSLQKRRYNKGYYFNKTNSSHEPTEEVVKDKVLKNKNLNQINNTKPETKEIEIVKENSDFKEPIIVENTNSKELAMSIPNEKKSKGISNISKSFNKSAHGYSRTADTKKTKVPFGMGDGGSLWGVIGAISAIISIIFLLIFLFSIGSIFSGIGSSVALGPVLFFGIIIIVLIAIGVLFIINSD